MTGAPAELVAALRSGTPLPDSRLESLRTFTGKLVQRRGWLEDADVQEFLAAGFEQQQVLEVVLGVTQKTLSNYANHLAGTPVDAAFAQFAWKEPSA
jgi:alkylhydroperoxidase family enzyme